MPESTDISRANSFKGEGEELLRNSVELQEVEGQDEDAGVQALGPDGEEQIVVFDGAGHGDEVEDRADTTAGKNYEKTMGKLAHVISKIRGDDKHDSATH